MPVTQLSGARIAQLRNESFNYDAIGATAGEFPAGFAALHRVRMLPAGVGSRRRRSGS